MSRTTMLAFVAGAAATGGLVFLTGLGPGDEKHDHHHDHDHGHQDATHQMSPEEEMEMWMKASMPGEHHAELGKVVGSWTAKTSFTMDPAAPPMEGSGTCSFSWVLGGRYVKSEFHMDDMMGMPFDGLGYSGYDNMKGEYVGTWMDTFGTGIMFMNGKKDGEKIVMKGKTMTPAGPEEMKIVSEWHDDDHFTDTFYARSQGGEWREEGKISYARN